MNKLSKTAIAAVAAAATLASTFNAEAGDWRRKHHRPVIVQQHNDDALVTGLIGLAAGAIIIGALTQPKPVYQPRPVTVYDYPAAPRVIHAPQVIDYDEGLEPWSRQWFRYCTNRSQSFNPETGTYLGHDGRRHFCAAD